MSFFSAFKIKFVILFSALLFCFASISGYCQKNETEISFYNPNKKFSVSVYGTFISSSQLQNNPKSSDPIEKNAMTTLKGGLGYGAELNFKPSLGNLDLTFFLSTEYFAAQKNDLYFRILQDTLSAILLVAEQFHMVPVEAGVKWDLPLSSNRVKVYIGGGGGLYFGDRIRTIANNLVSNTTYKKANFSLNILSGVDYFIGKNISANFEFKFREASFDVESTFTQNTININGQEFKLDNPVYSRIIVDGVRLSLGLRYSF